MQEVYFITHPNVKLDFNVPITKWDLSEEGRMRLEKLLKQPWIPSIKSIFSSNEQKAKTTALRIAKELGLEAHYIKELGEMDRSSTGPLPLEEFNKVVDEFFNNPDKSIRGWETAMDAQKRIVKAIDKAIEMSSHEGNIAIIAHGGVGALYLSNLQNISISRSQDQPGQGYYFVFDKDTKKLLQNWQAIDDLITV